MKGYVTRRLEFIPNQDHENLYILAFRLQRGSDKVNHIDYYQIGPVKAGERYKAAVKFHGITQTGRNSPYRLEYRFFDKGQLVFRGSLPK